MHLGHVCIRPTANKVYERQCITCLYDYMQAKNTGWC